MTKEKKDVMKPIASTGIYKCKNCYNDVSMNPHCVVCGRKMRGFFLEVEEYAKIQNFLGANPTNRLEIFIFGDQFYYSLKSVIAPKKGPKKEKVRCPYCNKEYIELSKHKCKQKPNDAK